MGEPVRPFQQPDITFLSETASSHKLIVPHLLRHTDRCSKEKDSPRLFPLQWKKSTRRRPLPFTVSPLPAVAEATLHVRLQQAKGPLAIQTRLITGTAIHHPKQSIKLHSSHRVLTEHANQEPEIEVIKIRFQFGGLFTHKKIFYCPVLSIFRALLDKAEVCIFVKVLQELSGPNTINLSRGKAISTALIYL